MGLRPSVNGSSNSKTERISEQNASPIENIDTKESNNQSPTPLPPVQRQAWSERGQLLLNFHDVISRAINSPEMINKCSRIAADMSDDETAQKKTKNSLAKDYSAEANLIIENKSRRDAEVRNKTLAVGLCVFGVLRAGRGISSTVRNAAANRAAAARSYKFDEPPSPAASKQTTPTESKVSNEQPSKLRRFLSLAFDLTLSTTVALFSGEYLFIPRPSSYIEDMAKLPMVEGKSLYAEMVCPPLLREYKHVLEKYGRWPVMSASEANSIKTDDGKPALTQEDVSLNIIRQFAENCSKRSKYEQALLQERNALANHRDYPPGLELFHRLTKGKFSSQKDEWVRLGDVVVPRGGVPEDVDVDLDKDVMFLENKDEKR